MWDQIVADKTLEKLERGEGKTLPIFLDIPKKYLKMREKQLKAFGIKPKHAHQHVADAYAKTSKFNFSAFKTAMNELATKHRGETVSIPKRLLEFHFYRAECTIRQGLESTTAPSPASPAAAAAAAAAASSSTAKNKPQARKNY
eukprot:GABV01008722.1.p3 GENE.GABV01008722.1~~GABV01008722.1.p3  ORF type:complete len:144 (+),score=49.93 GABV01008722.1:199-630(+)